MISIGFDLVDIERFARWHSYTEAQLARILCAAEISYCLSIPAQSAERFAVRFAAKEAFYKALSAHTPHNLPLLTVARLCHTAHGSHGPEFIVNWQALKAHGLSISDTIPAIKISLSHSKLTAGAVVILESQGFS